MVGHSFNVWPMKKGGEGKLDTVVLVDPSFLARKNDPVLFVPLGPRQFLFCLPNFVFLFFFGIETSAFSIYNIFFKDDREEEEEEEK
jgi:hypothetical protein